MKGVGITIITIPTVKAKVVAAIVLAMKVEVATLVMKAEEVTGTTPVTKVEVAQKKMKGEATKVENKC
jgi:hypothetical protein